MRQRDEHDISKAFNRTTTALGVDWRYLVLAFGAWLALLPHLDDIFHLHGFVLAVVAAVLAAALLYAAWFYGRDPWRLPTRLAALRRKQSYSPLKRRQL